MAKANVEIYECVHCGCLTLNPDGPGECACGNEFADISRMASPGTRIKNATLQDVVHTNEKLTGE